MIRRPLYLPPGIAIAVLLLLTAVPAFVSAQQTGTSILFVFDSSGSMTEPLGEKTKLQTAKDVLSALLGDLPPDTNVGLEVYGHRNDKKCDDIEMVFPVGKPDVGAMRQKIASLHALGNTPIAASLEKAAAELRGVQGKRTIVLISDGKETCGGDPVGKAELIKHEFGINVVIHTIGFAVDDEARQQLTKISKAGGGNYYAANNARQLKESLVQIKEEAVVVKEPPRTLFEEKFNGSAPGEKWEVVNDDPDNRILEDGILTIVNARTIEDGGEKQKGVSIRNFLLYKGDLPKDYEVEVKFSTAIPDFMHSHSSGLMLFKDASTYLSFVVYGTYDTYGSLRFFPWASFTKSLKGETDKGFGKQIGSKQYRENEVEQAQKPKNYYLKVRKEKFRYTAYFSEDGQNWTEVGTYTMIGKKLLPGIVAYRGWNAKEAYTEFDYFKIRGL